MYVFVFVCLFVWEWGGGGVKCSHLVDSRVDIGVYRQRQQPTRVRPVWCITAMLYWPILSPWSVAATSVQPPRYRQS